MKLEIEGHLGVELGTGSLVYRHPSGDYTVHLANLRMEPGCEKPLLSAFLTYDAESLEEAESVGEKYARSFGDFLAFTTGARFRVSEPLFVYDWTPGLAKREGLVFHYAPDPSLPQLVMNSEHAESLQSLLGSDSDSELMRALHWFAAGLAADAPDEQFQLFWFAIEIMARRGKSAGKIPDSCAKCRQPLFCPTCNETPSHRPYPAQAVEGLFRRHVSNEPDRAYRAASSMRHALTHAEDICLVESDLGLDLGRLVDVVGGVAWAALLASLRTQAIPPESGELCLIEPTTFRHCDTRVHAGVSFASPAGRDTEFTDVPDVTVRLVVEDAPQLGGNA